MRGRILAAVAVGATVTMMTGTIAIATRTQEGAAAIPAKTTIAPTPTATQPPTTTAATATTSVSADSAGLNESLAGAIGMLSSMTMDGTILPAPDAACFDTAVTGFDGDVSEAAAQLADDPLSWSSIPRETRLPIISAYVGCANIDAVVNLLAIGLINSLEASPCISAAWSGLLSAELIASTLAYGTGLDDLPPEVVNQLVDGAVPCLPDEPWWIDDIAIELERQYDFTPAQATCVATNFVHILGIDRAVERRVLTIPMLTLSDDDLNSIDLAGCGVTVTLPPMTAGDVGDCLAGMFREPEPREVACDTPHNAEILANIDLTDVPAWPGINDIDHRAGRLCRDAANAAAPNRNDIGLVWSVPTRQVWERGGRTVTCIIGPLDGSDWTAPSGLTPGSPTTTLVD